MHESGGELFVPCAATLYGKLVLRKFGTSVDGLFRLFVRLFVLARIRIATDKFYFIEFVS